MRRASGASSHPLARDPRRMPRPKPRLPLKVAFVLLPLSVACYTYSLTEDVASVVASIQIDDKGVNEMVTKLVTDNPPVDKIAEEVSTVVIDMVREKFSLFANPRTFQMIRQTIDEKVRLRASALMGELVPRFDLPEPDDTVKRMKLLTTIRDLYREGEWLLVFALVAFTIFFPVSKYVGLFFVMFSKRRRHRLRILSWLKSWGQWSMGDVFVVAFFVVWLRIDSTVFGSSRLATITMHVAVEPGLYFFAGSVVLAMIVSMMLGLVVRSDLDLAAAGDAPPPADEADEPALAGEAPPAKEPPAAKTAGRKGRKGRK